MPDQTSDDGGIGNDNRRFEQIETELLRLGSRIQDVAENFIGQKVRIDRQVGTMDDLLKRFEAWKGIGNEMGEEMRAQTEVMKAVDNRMTETEQQIDILVHHADQVTDVLRDLRDTLVAADLGDDDDQEACESDDDPADPEMAAQMGRSLEDLQNDINTSVEQRLSHIDERLSMHVEMLEALTSMASDIKTFITEVKQILGDRLTTGDAEPNGAVPSNTGGLPK